MPIPVEAFDQGSTVTPEPTLEYRLNPSGNDCRCCAHPECEEVDRLFMRRELSGKAAAERLGVSPGYYSTHIHRDVQRPIKEDVAKSPVVQDAITSTIDKVGELRTIFTGLIERAKILMRQPLEAKAEFRIKAIASEARMLGEFLMRLEGELKDSPLIVINQMNIQFNKVLELVMSEAPVPLQRKISSLLKEMDLEAHR